MVIDVEAANTSNVSQPAHVSPEIGVQVSPHASRLTDDEVTRLEAGGATEAAADLSATVLPGGWLANERAETEKIPSVLRHDVKGHSSVSEASFVPLHLVKKQVATMAADMNALRQRYMEAIDKLASHYEGAASDARYHYVAHSTALRAAALERLDQYRRALQRTTSALTSARKQRVAEVSALEHTVAKLRGDKAALQQAMLDAAAAAKSTHEEHVASLRDEHEAELVRLNARHAQSVSAATNSHSEQVATLGAQVDDLREQCTEANAEVASLRARLTDAVAQLRIRDSAVATASRQRRVVFHEVRECAMQCRQHALLALDSQRVDSAPTDVKPDSDLTQVAPRHATPVYGDKQRVVFVPKDGVSAAQIAEALPLALHELKERTVEREEASRSEAAAHRELASTSARLKENRAAIKAWLAEFEQREGRPAGKEDKKAVRELYARDRQLTASAESLVASVEDAKLRIHRSTNAVNAARDAVERLSALKPAGTHESAANPPATLSTPAVVPAEAPAASSTGVDNDTMQAAQATERVRIAEEALAKARHDLRDARDAAADAKRQADSADQRAELLRKRLEVVVANTSPDAAVADPQVALLASELEAANAARDQAVSSASAATTQASELRDSLSVANQRVADLSTELHALKQSMHEVQRPLEHAAAAQAAHSAGDGVAGSPGDTAETLQAQARADNAERRLEEVESELETTQLENSKLQDEVDQLTDRADELQRMLEAAQQQAAAAAVELELLQVQVCVSHCRRSI